MCMWPYTACMLESTEQGAYINDLGQITNETINGVEALLSLKLIITIQSQIYCFPNGCKRSFQLSWLHTIRVEWRVLQILGDMGNIVQN